MTTGPIPAKVQTIKTKAMILNSENYQKITDHFKGKFAAISYVGCWNDTTITFALYQTTEQRAGVEIWIKKPEGDTLQTVQVVNCRRLQAYSMDQDRQYRRKYLPILIP